MTDSTSTEPKGPREIFHHFPKHYREYMKQQYEALTKSLSPEGAGTFTEEFDDGILFHLCVSDAEYSNLKAAKDRDYKLLVELVPTPSTLTLKQALNLKAQFLKSNWVSKTLI